MEVTIVDGHLKINFADLVEHLSEDAKIDLIEHLSCDETVIKNVVAQLLQGWTELGSHGPRSYGKGRPFYGMEVGRARIAAGASEVAAKDISELRRTLVLEEEAHEKTRRDFYERLAKYEHAHV